MDSSSADIATLGHRIRHFRSAKGLTLDELGADAGVAGSHAIEMAHGLRANVIAIDRSIKRLRELDVQFRGSVRTLFSTAEAIETFVADADLVVGAVLPRDPLQAVREHGQLVRDRVRLPRFAERAAHRVRVRPVVR